MKDNRALTHREKIDIFRFITLKTRAGQMFGRTAPAYSKGTDIRYERLAPLKSILDEINAEPTLPNLSENTLRILMKSFRGGPPRLKASQAVSEGV